MSRILVVDDNSDCLFSLAALLRHSQHEVAAVASGESAPAEVAAQDFDLVLLDLVMPEMDGYEVARRLRQTFAGAAPRIIALTGYWPAGRQQGAELFDDFLLKPIDLRHLLEVVAGQRCGSALIRD